MGGGGGKWSGCETKVSGIERQQEAEKDSRADGSIALVVEMKKLFFTGVCEAWGMQIYEKKRREKE